MAHHAATAATGVQGRNGCGVRRDVLGMGSDLTYARARALCALTAVLLSALLFAGCAPWRADPTVGSSRILGQRVWVTVTRNGGRDFVTRRSLPLDQARTALDALQNVADVRFTPDGTLAQVNGEGGGRLGPHGPVASSWYYRVDGVEDVGVAPEKFRLHPGQSVWWDLRRFDIYEHLPVAIGNFPEPLFSGFRDNQRPLRISYGSGFQKDAEFMRDTIFDALDPDVVAISGDEGFGGIGGEDSRSDKDLKATVAVRRKRANFVIGRWEQLQMDPFILDMGTDPRGFGLTYWIEGTEIRRQDPDEEFSHVLTDAEGIVWATTTDAEPDSTLVFVVTGTTERGVRGALRALAAGSCQYYLACAVDRDGDVVR
jgi:hypothetical protein